MADVKSSATEGSNRADIVRRFNNFDCAQVHGLAECYERVLAHIHARRDAVDARSYGASGGNR